MIGGGGSPEEIVEEQGLRQLSKPAELEPLIEQVFDAHPDSVAALRAGEGRQRGFLIGQVMKASGGRANPQVLGRLIQAKIQQG
jgi:Asp-tRNA(Asn)/Glu-tRNA(Gln) amidotransferase B subunit